MRGLVTVAAMFGVGALVMFGLLWSRGAPEIRWWEVGALSLLLLVCMGIVVAECAAAWWARRPQRLRARALRCLRDEHEDIVVAYGFMPRRRCTLARLGDGTYEAREERRRGGVLQRDAWHTESLYLALDHFVRAATGAHGRKW
jgi:hypothetical protein